MLRRCSVCSAASAARLGHSGAKGEGWGQCRGDNRGVAGVAEKNKEVAPNYKTGADSIALASVLLLGRDIMDEEGAAPKENPLAAMPTLHWRQ